MIVIEGVKDAVLATFQRGNGDAPSSRVVHLRVGSKETGIGTDGRVRAGKSRNTGYRSLPSRRGIDDHIRHIDQVPGIRMPRRVPPFRSYEEEAGSRKIIADEHFAVTGHGASKVSAPRRRQLENDSVQIWTQDRKEQGNRLIAEPARDRIRVLTPGSFCGDYRTEFAGSDVQQFDVAVLPWSPMWPVKRHRVSVCLPP